MPRYLSQHTLACLTRQGAEELTRRILAAKTLSALRIMVNMQEGKMLVEFRRGEPRRTRKVAGD